MSPLTLLLLVFGVCSACLITNCPRGGKRSGLTRQSSEEMQCTTCGPRGEGLCVAPGICCSASAGCLVTAQGPCTRMYLPRCTAHPLPVPCGPELSGRCAADGVCCSHDSCRLDEICYLRDSNELIATNSDSDALPGGGSVRLSSSSSN